MSTVTLKNLRSSTVAVSCFAVLLRVCSAQPAVLRSALNEAATWTIRSHANPTGIQQMVPAKWQTSRITMGVATQKLSPSWQTWNLLKGTHNSHVLERAYSLNIHIVSPTH